MSETKPKKKKEYLILQANTIDEMIDEVERHLADRWELQGGISVVAYPDEVNGNYTTRTLYHQAMIRAINGKGEAFGF